MGASKKTPDRLAFCFLCFGSLFRRSKTLLVLFPPPSKNLMMFRLLASMLLCFFRKDICHKIHLGVLA